MKNVSNGRADQPEARAPTSASTALRLILAIGAVSLALAMIGAGLSHETSHRIFSESGPVEWVTILLWIACSVAIPTLFRASLASLAGAGLALAAAAREADWHKAFTSDSMLKPNFYTDAAHDPVARVLGALVVAATVACVVLVVRRVVQMIKEDPRGLPPWGAAASVAVGLLIFSKGLDRAPAILNETFSVELSRRLVGVLRALEEGLEAALPVFFVVAIIVFVRERARLDASEPGASAPVSPR